MDIDLGPIDDGEFTGVVRPDSNTAQVSLELIFLPSSVINQLSPPYECKATALIQLRYPAMSLRLQRRLLTKSTFVDWTTSLPMTSNASHQTISLTMLLHEWNGSTTPPRTSFSKILQLQWTLLNALPLQTTMASRSRIYSYGLPNMCPHIQGQVCKYGWLSSPTRSVRGRTKRADST